MEQLATVWQYDRFCTCSSLQLYDSMTGSVHGAACNCITVWQVLYMQQLATVWQYDRFCTWSSLQQYDRFCTCSSLQLYESMTGSVHGAACNCMTVRQVLYMEQLATVWQYDRFFTWSSLQLYDSMTGSLHVAACNFMTVWQVQMQIRDCPFRPRVRQDSPRWEYAETMSLYQVSPLRVPGFTSVSTIAPTSVRILIHLAFTFFFLFRVHKFWPLMKNTFTS